jgi:hypothetical protein
MKPSELKERIDKLAGEAQPQKGRGAHSLYQGALSVMSALHGPDSVQVKSFTKQHEQIVAVRGVHADHDISIFSIGAINNLKAEIDAGFVGSLQQTIAGEVISDFIDLARHVMDQDDTDAGKNVAAVLSAAAFEDTIRRLATKNRIPHFEKLADVLNELKIMSVLQGAQVGIANGYLNFRNSALHAQWNRIVRAGVARRLGFVEQLLLAHFV